MAQAGPIELFGTSGYATNGVVYTNVLNLTQLYHPGLPEQGKLVVTRLKHTSFNHCDGWVVYLMVLVVLELNSSVDDGWDRGDVVEEALVGGVLMRGSRGDATRETRNSSSLLLSSGHIPV